MKDIVTTPVLLDEMRDEVRAVQARSRAVLDAYHETWYAAPFTQGLMSYCGRPLLKSPNDMWMYHEILWAHRPTLVIETGTAYGASALYFCHQFDLVGEGQVLTIDIEPADSLPTHPRLTALTASSTHPDVVRAVRSLAARHPRVMVVLDSDHSPAHVAAELDAYGPLVTEGQYLVVEDTNIGGNPVWPDTAFGAGPAAALRDWLPAHPEFTPDVWAERYLFTLHPHGWLKRVA